MAFAAEHGFVETDQQSDKADEKPVVPKLEEFVTAIFETQFMPTYRPATVARYLGAGSKIAIGLGPMEDPATRLNLQAPESVCRNGQSCRGERIRTSDSLVPNQVRYQAALRPVTQPGRREGARECGGGRWSRRRTLSSDSTVAIWNALNALREIEGSLGFRSRETWAACKVTLESQG
jgi:hypothetical protein